MRRPNAGSVVLLLATAAVIVWPLVSLADPPGWVVDPYAFEYDMSVIATVDTLEAETPDISDTLGAFVDGECRGVAGAWETPVGDYIFLVTVRSNQAAGEDVFFKYYDGSVDRVLRVEETITFVADTVVGSLIHPEPLTPTESGSWAAIKALFR